jgi:hypothetical protein
MPTEIIFSNGYKISGLLAIGSICLLVVKVSGYMRVPLPPAAMIAFILPSFFSFLRFVVILRTKFDYCKPNISTSP